jgi:hypothetical protein
MRRLRRTTEPAAAPDSATNGQWSYLADRDGFANQFRRRSKLRAVPEPCRIGPPEGCLSRILFPRSPADHAVGYVSLLPANICSTTILVERGG